MNDREDGRYSINDIARLTGVSKSTVSRVLNNHPYVSEDTKKRVTETIERIRYRPNPYAQSVASGKTKIVGLLVPNLSSLFYTEIVEGIVDEITDSGYGVLLYKSEGKKEDLLKEVLRRGTTAGIITITPRFKEKDFLSAFGTGLPFVLINHRNEEIDAPYVCSDNYLGGYAAGEYLVGLGHDRIAAIVGRQDSQSTSERFRGFKKALSDEGTTLSEDRVAVKGRDFDDQIADAVVAWMHSDPIPTAIFAYADSVAFEVISVLKEMGLEVPGDVSVLGYDNIRMSSYSRPPLTTVSQFPDQIGKSGAQLLLALIEESAINETHLTIKPKIVIRESCGIPKTQ